MVALGLPSSFVCSLLCPCVFVCLLCETKQQTKQPLATTNSSYLMLIFWRTKKKYEKALRSSAPHKDMWGGGKETRARSKSRVDRSLVRFLAMRRDAIRALPFCFPLAPARDRAGNRGRVAVEEAAVGGGEGLKDSPLSPPPPGRSLLFCCLQRRK